MRWRPRRVRWIGMSLAIAAIFWIIWAVRGQDRIPGKRLPDGTVVRLAGATYGGRHLTIERYPGQALLGSVLPSALRSRFGAEPIWVAHSSRGLTPYFLIYRRRGKQGPYGQFADAVDEHGCLYLAPSNHHGAGPPTVFVPELPRFPRRSPTVSLRFKAYYFHSRLNRTVRFTTPNPVRGPFPIWQPEPLPATRTTGDLAVTLTGLVSGLDQANPTRPAAPEAFAKTALRLRLVDRGRAAKAWQPVSVTFSDATGNTERSPAAEVRRSGADWLVSSALCREEPAWKVGVELSRRGGPPDEVWRLTAVPVPLPGNFGARKALPVAPGVELTLYNQPLKGGAPDLRGELTLPRPGLDVVVSARGSDGRMYSGRDASWFDRGDDRIGSAFNLRLGANVMQVDLTFRVYRTRSVEFIAKPERLERRVSSSTESYNRQSTASRRDRNGPVLGVSPE